jgi:hypothetical protein
MTSYGKESIREILFLLAGEAMALDLSNSVSGAMLNELKTAGDGLLKGLAKNERAALITFNNRY